MNNYKKLHNLIKPEFRDLYAITKNSGENNTFQLAFVNLVSGQRHLNNVMTFRNNQNSMTIMKDGKHPYVSDVSSVYSSEIFNHLNISEEVSGLIYSIINFNNKKHEMHLFFENLFSSSNILKNYKCSTAVKIKISEDYSNVEYIMIEHVHDIAFRKDNIVLQNSDPVRNLGLFNKLKTYIKKQYIIIDVKAHTIIIEHLDNEEVEKEVMSFDEFNKKDVFKVDEIKNKGKEFLLMKINDIDAFDWSAADDN